MITLRILATALACCVAGAALAQTGSKPLDLKLPRGYTAPAATSTSPAPASNATVDHGLPALPPGRNEMPPSQARVSPAASRSTAPVSSGVPGVYYGDHSNSTAADYAQRGTPQCDDYSYNKPQVHGSVSTGVVSASHYGTTGYSGGNVTLSKAFGSCDDPEGGISISVGGITNDGFGGRPGWRH